MSKQEMEREIGSVIEEADGEKVSQAKLQNDTRIRNGLRENQAYSPIIIGEKIAYSPDNL